MSILQFKRGPIIPTDLQQSELFYNTDLHTIQMSKTDGTGDNITLTKLNEINSGSFHVSGELFAGSLEVETIDVTDNLTVSGDLTTLQNFSVSGNSILNTLTVTGQSTLQDVEVLGNTLLNSSLTVTDELIVSGSSTFLTESNFNNGVIIQEGMTVTGLAVFNSGIIVFDDTNLSNLNVSGVSSFNGDTEITGSLTVTKPSSFKSDVGVTGSVLINNDLRSSGSAYVGENLVVTGSLHVYTDAQIDGSLTVEGLTSSGDTNLDGSLSVTQNSSFNTVEIADTLDVGGNSTLSNVLVNGSSVLSGSLDVTQNTTLSNTTINGILDVTGPQTTLQNNLTVNGETNLSNTDVDGTLNVSSTSTFNGPTSINNTLGVTGMVTFDSGLGVSGKSTLSDTDINGNVILSGSLDVTGLTSFDSNVELGSNLGVTGSVSILDNLSVGGTSTLTGNTSIGGTLTVDESSTFNSNVTINGSVDGTSFSGVGTNLTNLDANNITLGTVDYARLPISSTQTSNWDTAYGWGDHSTVGYELQSNKGVAGGYVPLDGSTLIPNQYLPDLAITDVSVVPDITARDAITPNDGDIAIVEDASDDPNIEMGSATYIWDGTQWEELKFVSAVSSVNSKTGTVILDFPDFSGTITDSQHGSRSGGSLHSTVTTSVHGFMSSSDKVKLNGIEEGAEVNVPTNLSITGTGDTRTLESSTGTDTSIPIVTQSNAGFMSILDKTKLDGIEDGAEVNVGTDLSEGGTGNSRTIISSTGGNVTISTATSTNAGYMSTSDKSKLDDIESGAQVNVDTDLGITGTGNSRTITSSTGDNVSIPTGTTSNAGFISIEDKTKLNGIESGAEVNQSDSEIKTQYENNTNTNAFTDDEKSKLGGIESGAQVNVKSDWDSTSGDSEILNKPFIVESSTDLTDSTDLVRGGDNLSRLTDDLNVELLENKGVGGGYAPLDGSGIIPDEYLPSLAITDVTTVATITERDQLSPQNGDIAIIEDASGDPNIEQGSATYIWDGDQWEELKFISAVSSVNGKTGTVVLDFPDFSGTITDSQHGNRGGGSLHSTATQNTAGFISSTDKTKLDDIEAGAEVNVDTNLGFTGSGNVRTVTSSTGTNTDLDIATQTDAGLLSIEDKTKLDGIEEGAEVNVGTNLGQGGSGDNRTITSSTGDNVTISTATSSNAGFMATDDKTKLDGIEDGAEVNVDTNLGITGTGNSRTITSSTGGNVSIPTGTTSTAGFISTGDKTKLDGIEDGAEVNEGTDLGISGTGNTREITSSTGGNVSIPTGTTSTAGFISTTDKTKLNNIESGAQVNVKSDWNSTSGDSEILNKPFIVESSTDLSDSTSLVRENDNVSRLTDDIGIEVQSNKGVAGGYVPLDGSTLIPSQYLPDIAITEVNVVPDIAARDALTPESGDVAIVEDASDDPDIEDGLASYIWDGDNWQLMRTAATVSSVNGQTGTIVLDFPDFSGSINDSQHGNRGGGSLHSTATTSTDGFMSSTDKTKLNDIESGAQVNVGTNLGISGSGNSRTITSSTGDNVSIPTGTTSNAGFISTTDKTKLDGIEDGAEVNVGTNLGITGTGNTRSITSSTGDNVSIPTVTTSTAGFMGTGDKTKLDGIESGAQVNVGDEFNENGTYSGLRAQSTTQGDVGLGNVPNWTGSTSSSLGTSNTTIASQGAIKSYVDGGLSDKLNLSGGTLTGKITFNDSYHNGEAPINLPRIGTSNPSDSVDGDIWYRSSNLYYNNLGTIRTVAHTDTWSTMSVSEGTTGTSTTPRLMRADTLEDIIHNYAVPINDSRISNWDTAYDLRATGLSMGSTGTLTLTRAGTGNLTTTISASDVGAEPSFSKGNLSSGSGISVSGGSGVLVGSGASVENTDRGSSQNIFKNIATADGTVQFSASDNDDTIRFAGNGATWVEFNETTNSVTISSSNTTYSAGDGIDLSGTTFSVGGGDGLTQQTTGLAVDSTVVRTNETYSNPTWLSALSATKLTSGTLPNARLSDVPNSALANSTISGVSLGGSLSNLSLGTGLQFSSGTTYDGSTSRSISITSDVMTEGDSVLDLTSSNASRYIRTTTGGSLIERTYANVRSDIGLNTSDNVRFDSLGVGMNASGTSGRIDAAGDIVAFSSSDMRLKSEVIPITDSLDKVKSIGGYTHKWDEDTKDIHGYDTNTEDVGVIAQEVEKILPQVVTTRDNGYKAVKYEKLVPLLIESIKELSDKVDYLENKLKEK